MGDREMIRLSLQITTEVNDRLETIARETGVTKSDVLRKALGLIELAHRGKKEGKRLGFAKSDEVLETEIVGI